MKFFIATFDKLLADRRRSGYIDLVAPTNFERQVEFERRARDAAEGLMQVPEMIRMEDIPDVVGLAGANTPLPEETLSRAHRNTQNRSPIRSCGQCGMAGHYRKKCTA